MQMTDLFSTDWALIAVMVALVLAGCTSDPSPKGVARDIITAEARRDPSLDEDCLLARLDAFPEDELNSVDGGLRSNNESEREAAQATLRAFELSLAGCVEPGTND